MKSIMSILVLVSFFLQTTAYAAVPFKVDGLRSNGNVEVNGSISVGTGAAPNSKAILDLTSTTKGLLPPRMTTAQRTAISSPPTGLMVYDTDTLTVWQYNGTGWIEVGSGGTSGAQYNVITNYGFEATSYSEDWTASGGTLAAAAGSNILFGAQSATWDASASTQTLSYASQAIGEGYKSNNCEGAIYIKTPSGTATHTVQVWDGTNVLASVSVYSTTTAKQFSTGPFPCPSSGNWQLRVVANADEPLIALDDAYLGLARNVGVADLITEWRSYTPSLTSSGGGAITLNATGKTDPFGRWRQVGDSIEIEVGFKNGSGGAATGSAGVLQFGLPPNSAIDPNKAVSTSAFAYSVGSGEVYPVSSNFSPTNGVAYNGGILQLTKNGTAGSFVVADIVASFEVRMRVKYPVLGWSASTVVMPDAQGLSWSGYHAATCSWTTTSTSYADPADDASCTLSERTNRNFGAVVTYGAAKPGITFTPRKSGTYFVCARSALYNSTLGSYSTMSLGTTGGTSASIASGGIRQGTSSATNDEKSVTLCGLVNLTSATSTTVRLQIAASANTTTLGDASTGGSAIEWSIFNVDQPVQAILANSVSTGTPQGDRIVRGKLNCDSASVVTNTNTTGLTIGNISAGACTVTFPTAFSTVPNCTATNTGCSALSGVACFNWVTATTTTTVGIDCASDSGAECTISNFEMICIGPR